MHYSTVLQSIVFSEFLCVLVTDLSVGAPPAAEAPPCVFQVLRKALCGVDLEDTWCQASEEVRDEATLCAWSTSKINNKDHKSFVCPNKNEIKRFFYTQYCS